MDAAQSFRERIQSLLVRGLASERVRSTLGVQGVSEVWGGAAPLDRPAWYFWLRGAPGAYRLGLEEAATEDGEPTRLVGSFSIRYYPSPHDPVFAGFSVEEREFVVRGFLDETGTPRVERAHDIPDDLFNVGVLEYVRHSGGGAAELSFASMDRLRVRYDEDARIAYGPLGITISHARGEVARSVPGWELGARLFRCLAGLHAHFEQTPPSQVTVLGHAGTEFARRAGRFECVASEATLGEAIVRFGVGAPPLAEAAPDCIPLTLDLDEGWWGLAGAPHVEHAVSCACGHERRGRL